MSDDKSKVGKPDRSKINTHESYEVYDTAKKLLKQAPPGTTLQQAQKAVIESGRVPEFHNDRKMVENAALAKLGVRPKLPHER